MSQGAKSDSMMVVAQLEDVQFSVGVTQYYSGLGWASDLKKLLESVLIGYRGADRELQFLGSQQVLVGRLPARHFMLRLDGRVIEAVSLVASSSVYTIMVAAPIATYDQADFERFMAGFRLLPTLR